MNRNIENIHRTRLWIIDHVKDLSLEKLNLTPHGFNNNIIWNMGHLVAAHQSICYTKGGLQSSVPEETYALFKPGTKPDRFFDNNEEDEIKKLLLTSLDLFQRDYQQQYFENFTPWTNRYGNTLNNIDDAITYVSFHEGLHLGIISSIKKLVQK